MDELGVRMSFLVFEQGGQLSSELKLNGISGLDAEVMMRHTADMLANGIGTSVGYIQRADELSAILPSFRDTFEEELRRFFN